LALGVGAQAPGLKRPKTYPSFDVTHKKPHIKHLPIKKMQTRRLATSFVSLNSYLALSPNELWSCKVAQK